MSNVIEFPKQNQAPEKPDYSGHILMLDLSKARRWYCFNFFLGIRCRTAVVPEDASMEAIHGAVEAGILIDITEHPELFVPEKPIAAVDETDTGKRVYSGLRSFFRDLGIADDDMRAPADETVSYATEDPDEQRRIAEALAAQPVVQPAPVSPEEARQRARRPFIVTAPGMDDPDRYLLPIPQGLS